MKVPGDKSMTQRALILSALSGGESRISGLLPGADPRVTAGALRSLGVEIPELPADGSEIRVRGRGLRGLKEPAGALDLGNSGTGARLLLGVLSGQPLEAVVTGDSSLRSRPMDRVIEPLSAMGAEFEALEAEGRLPLRVRGGELKALEYETPVASAQVKSALLLAGLVGGVFVLLTEPGRSRDHTERMLRLAGVPVIGHSRGSGWRVELRDPPDALR
ncbi:MAG: 3-phosphoshikimate 1-carboxyvinyltransferase, partial [Gemmatimonadetes bacterium]|nr:3-phosphoshikimate 1-carboxyvinyltransferase [Gemmatimonadota bacterium]NIR78412.1 3-phosphoshikimate 1-carboxyvinyltransferase [Gemmatimonadota bacterium]NIT87024.1 3-phosphoshikimate 1-carboxyvinyltransferase [Gemmatimonadota bacterium]NIU30862.1 3-phosphoshikimate 1-carboxyvinyltransferase [Gemmatimonadota bacterium]NIU35631.1 3-phosphoshikimate 1-carboxyvinyltransferase [Gemmatimonadota bacterium]